MKKTQVDWTLKEIGILHQLCENRMSAAQIYGSMLLRRHTEESIRTRITHMGLSRTKAHDRAVRAQHNSLQRRQEIIAFLKHEGKTMPAYVAAKKLQITEQMVYYYRREHGAKLPDHLRFTSERFINSHSHVVSFLRLGLARSRRSFWERRREQMRRQRKEDLLFRRTRYSRKCRKCEEVWPLTLYYFYNGRMSVAGTRLISWICRGCGPFLNRKATK